MFKYIDGCSDCRYLYASLTAEQLTIIENILTAYNSGKIDMITPEYDDNTGDWYGEFELIINDETYIEVGSELLVIKWYEGIEDTGYFVECFND